MKASPFSNDLHLTVTSPGGPVYLGNVFNGVSGESTTGGTADTLNNTENAILSGPQVGTWTVTVAPSDGNYSVGQGYALVITGDVSEDVTPNPPTANFSGVPTSGTAPLTVTFTDLSTGSPTSWSWNFGDGNTSTAQNPTHTYTAADSYSVSLTATNGDGSDTLIRTNYISVSALPDPPITDFTGSPTSGTVPLTVDFTDLTTGSPTSWSWDFGDGGTSTVQNPTYVYNTPGTYSVSLTASNAGGSNTLTRTDYITVSSGGVTGEGYVLSRNPDFSTDDRIYNTSETIYMLVFSDQVDFTDMKAATWELKAGGDRVKQNLTNNSDGTFTAAFALSGLPSTATNWTWKAKIEDNLGNRYRPQDAITVTPGGGGNPPLTDFSGSPTSGTAPLTVSFTDLSTENPTSWSWDFGDGGTSNAQDPSYTYTVPGTYDVTLTATNAAGSDTLTRFGYVTVSAPTDPPVADFSGTPTSGTVPLTVVFTDLSTGAPTSWSWDFGDGGTSSVQNPTYTYNSEGTYNVTLTATNANGSNALTLTGYITVSPDGGVVGEGYILSKNPDFSTDDRTFSTIDTIYMLVWSDQVDFTDMKTNSWELKAGGNRVKQNLTNNSDGTFTAAFALSELPSTATNWTWKAKIEDNSGNRFRPQDAITVLP